MFIQKKAPKAEDTMSQTVNLKKIVFFTARSPLYLPNETLEKHFNVTDFTFNNQVKP